MLGRFTTSLALALVVVLLVVAPALAGGWATIALDSPPQAPVVGKTLHVGFTVLQHGHNPVNDIYGSKITPRLTATNRDTDETVRAEARQQGAVGHFVVDVRFPSTGIWEWEITPDPFPLVTDPEMVTEHTHATGDDQGTTHVATDAKPVIEFAPLTVSSPGPAVFGMKLGDAARAGSLAMLALIPAVAAVLAVRRSRQSSGA